MEASENINKSVIDGKKEWLERYGSYIQAAYHWRLIAMGSCLVSLGLVVGLTYLGSKSKFTPYIIEIDAAGNLKVSLVHDVEEKLKQRVLVSQIKKWIQELRSVVGDKQVQNTYLQNSFNMVAFGSPANKFLTNHFSNEEADPYKIMKSKRVSVEIINMSQVSNSSWQIDWKESISSKNGESLFEKKYRAIVKTISLSHQNESEIYNNPIGVLINEISWSRIN